MQHCVLRATACAACLLIGSAAFAQGANYSAPRATRVVMHGAAIGGGGMGGGGVHGNFSGGGMRGWQGGGYGGYGGWGPDYAYGWGYPDYDYGWDYDYPDYAYDYGYPYDTYAEGAYCQTPETSCPLDHPAVAGQACQCRSGIDEVPGTTQP